MSVFSGCISEYPDIAVDKFTAEECSTFFLSHFHSDHIVGLEALHRKVRIFCSSITRSLLLADKRFQHLTECLIGLEIDVPHKITVERDSDENGLELEVTLMQAGHCLGSVMFLFAGEEGCVLYTGDFRLDIGDAERMRTLHHGLQPLPLRTIYLDTTFFSPSSPSLPDRHSSLEALIGAVDEWLDSRHNRAVHLTLRAKFSYEFLLEMLRQRFGDKIHMTPGQVHLYADLTSDISCLTCDPTETRIHACYNPDRSKDSQLVLPCQRNLPVGRRSEVLEILPTTLYFVSSRTARSSLRMERVSHNFLRVCFSFHSSFKEILHFLEYLKPQRAEACVVAIGDENLAETQCRLESVVQNISKNVTTETTKKFGRIPSRKRKRNERDDQFDDLDFGIEAQPTVISSAGDSTGSDRRVLIPEEDEEFSFDFAEDETGMGDVRDGEESLRNPENVTKDSDTRTDEGLPSSEFRNKTDDAVKESEVFGKQSIFSEGESPSIELPNEPTEDIPAGTSARKPTEGSPAKKSASKPTEDSPATKSARKPTEGSPAKKSTGKPTEGSPAKKSAGKPTEDSPAKKSARTPTEGSPAKKSTGKPTEGSPAKKSAGKPTEDSPAKKSTGKPTEGSPARKSAGKPTEDSPAKKSARTPTEGSPAKKSTGKPTEGSSAKKSAGKPTEGSPARKSARKPTEDSTATKSTSKPTEDSTATKSASKPTEDSPAKKSTRKPTEGNPAKKSAGKPTEGNPAKKSARKPTEVSPAKKSTGKPTEGSPAKKSARKPTEISPARKSATKPTEVSPAKKSTGKPTEGSPAKKSARKPTEGSPAKKSARKPTEISPARKSATKPTEGNPAKKSAGKPTEGNPAKTSAGKPTEVSPAKKSARKATEGNPAKKSARRPTEGSPAKKSARKPTEDSPAKKSARRPTEGSPVKKSARKPTEVSPAKKSARKATEGSPVKKSTGKPTEGSRVKGKEETVKLTGKRRRTSDVIKPCSIKLRRFAPENKDGKDEIKESEELTRGGDKADDKESIKEGEEERLEDDEEKEEIDEGSDEEEDLAMTQIEEVVKEERESTDDEDLYDNASDEDLTMTEVVEKSEPLDEEESEVLDVEESEDEDDVEVEEERNSEDEDSGNAQEVMEVEGEENSEDQDSGDDVEVVEVGRESDTGEEGSDDEVEEISESEEGEVEEVVNIASDESEAEVISVDDDDIDTQRTNLFDSLMENPESDDEVIVLS